MDARPPSNFRSGPPRFLYSAMAIWATVPRTLPENIFVSMPRRPRSVWHQSLSSWSVTSSFAASPPASAAAAVICFQAALMISRISASPSFWGDRPAMAMAAKSSRQSVATSFFESTGSPAASRCRAAQLASSLRRASCLDSPGSQRSTRSMRGRRMAIVLWPLVAAFSSCSRNRLNSLTGSVAKPPLGKTKSKPLKMAKKSLRSTRVDTTVLPASFSSMT
mmetsp:Transcript_17900/g.58237  ORF Transcript_17900/g.58237 Transcript_17900/m.58237 type:complete len:221 (+) Transcript_17900:1018-1680(+)